MDFYHDKYLSNVHFQFDNGWTASVTHEKHKTLAEVWAWKGETNYPDSPSGYLTDDNVAEFIEKVRKF